MKGIVHTKYGPPDVLELKKGEKPVPKEDEALVKVHAASLNGLQSAEWVTTPPTVISSTGIDSSSTAPGLFQVQTHEPNAYAGNRDLWMPSFMDIYRPMPTSDFMNGFHGFSTRGNAQLLWTNDLGRPVTYGCILLSSENASLVYEWAEDGVVEEEQP